MDTGRIQATNHPETTASFGYWVRRRRLSLDLTQADLARKVGCARITVSKIERDERRPSRQMAELLADRLAIPETERERFLAVALGKRTVDAMPLPNRPSGSALAASEGPTPSNLPLPTTPFVGRRGELQQLIGRLEQPDCRLLTLVGPGGFGKTRLGIRLGELALERPHLVPDGVFFVALDGLESSAWTVPAVAAALNFSFHGQGEQESQLLSYLKSKQMLLILDNAEGILSSDLIVNILGNAPGLKLLVTSREALNVREEWFHPIPGMSLGKSDGDTRDGDDDAIEFFRRCAMRVRPDFEPAREHAHVQTICRSVGGVPLAIELAAAWLKALTCEQVAQELSRSIDILTSSMRDVPERHRSLRAVLEQSWRHLTAEEQRVFRTLSIFAGGFLPGAAKVVAGAPLPVLAGLVDKSVLQFAQDGRYRIHALLRQIGEERLAANAGEFAAVAARHSEFYLNFLGERSQTVSGPDQRQVLLEVQAEMDNFRPAWRHAARCQAVDALVDALPCLFRFLWVRGRYAEGEQLFAEALDALHRDRLPRQERGLQTTLLARRALFAAAAGETARARTILEDATASVDIAEMTAEKALCDYVAGMVFTYDYVPDAYEPLRSAYESYQTLGDAAATAEAALRLAFIVNWMFGDFATGRSLVDKSLRIYRRLGDLAGIADALAELAAMQWAYGDYDDAEESLAESLDLARDINDRFRVARVIGLYGHVAEGRSQWDRAVRLFQEQLERMREIGHGYWTQVAFGQLGGRYVDVGRYDNAIEIYDADPFIRSFPWFDIALIAVGRYAEALDSLLALATAMASGERRWVTADNLISWAVLLTSDCPLLRNGQPFSRAARTHLAREILALVRDYDADRSLAMTRARAARLLAELEEQQAPAEPATVPVDAAMRSVEEIAAELLTITIG